MITGCICWLSCSDTELSLMQWWTRIRQGLCVMLLERNTPYCTPCTANRPTVPLLTCAVRMPSSQDFVSQLLLISSRGRRRRRLLRQGVIRGGRGRRHFGQPRRVVINTVCKLGPRHDQQLLRRPACTSGLTKAVCGLGHHLIELARLGQRIVLRQQLTCMSTVAC